MKKFFAVFLCAVLLVSLIPGLPAMFNQTVYASGTYKFDFGSDSSPLEAGYTLVSNTMKYSMTRGYGLSTTTDFRDRGAPDALRRDFTILGSSYSFMIDLPNGDYAVKIISGDQIASNRTSIDIEGVSYGTISSSSGSFAEFKRVITLTDGQLNFTFGRDGRVNAIEIAYVEKPSGLRIVSKTLTSPTSATIGWNVITGAASYNIYRIVHDPEEGKSTAVKIGSSITNQYTDTAAELGFTYEYMVSQITADGFESKTSSPISVSMTDGVTKGPGAPTGLALVSALETSVTLSWAPVTNAANYYVYRKKTLNGPYVKIGATTQTQYTENIETTRKHYYKVYAANAGGLSAASAVLETPIVKVYKRQMEKIDRALVAVPTQNGIYIGWRMLGDDPTDVSFNLYRNGVKVNATAITGSTNYVDSSGTTNSTYEVRGIIGGVEQVASGRAAVWSANYLDVPLQVPAGGTTPDNVTYTYRANDASLGDVDGDGTYEIILKWDPSNSKDNAHSGYTGNVYVDAYKLNGTRLWRIDLGRNIRAGAHYTQFMVYDLDGDGKAEIAMKTADGTVDGVGTVIGNPNADYRNTNGYVLDGPEFLTIFEGATGRALATTNYNPPRGNVCDWGDCYGNRVDRFLAGIAYLDGERPSLIMSRGYYTRTVIAAWNWRGGLLTNLWTFDTNNSGYSEWAGQGNHQLSIADVDYDGKDEIIFGAMAVDHDGKGLYNTKLGHGDALHVGDFDPSRPGLEVFDVHESHPNPAGIEFRDAERGQLIWGVATNYDVGRGTAGDIDPRYPGAEMWAIDGGGFNSPTGGLYSTTGTRISTAIPPANHVIWWDGDLLREILDHTWDSDTSTGVGKIDKWDYINSRTVNLLTPTGTYSNNHTKGNPCLQADLFGDWREEVIWRLEDSSALRIFTTTDVTNHRLYTLMHNPLYRLGIAWQNVAYNQPPHTDYFLGHGMTTPPMPNIYPVGSNTTPAR
ncbi:hypothetical protein PAAL109150_23845 [Paenibacillus alkaliterrae]|uniref:rhamnogalacturonan lyase family protein n=1 Tax=Paenibacillus alkaliterrae TaxID=320909 RepID=UPI002E23DE5F